MTSVKEKMAAVINAQPDDATYDDILRELAFERMVARGLNDARQGRVLSEAEMARRIEEWQK
jgi:predicted transcriptional regulator